MHHLQTSLEQAEKFKRFDPSHGYAWADDAAIGGAAAVKRQAPAPDRRLHGRVSQLIAAMPQEAAPQPDGLKRRGDAMASPVTKKAK